MNNGVPHGLYLGIPVPRNGWNAIRCTSGMQDRRLTLSYDHYSIRLVKLYISK